MKSQKRIPRGIRNNNPLNIRVGNNWIGEVRHPSDPSFEQFVAMKWGCRAGFIVLRNYIERHKCNTIRKIITRWAPPGENNTKAYIKAVCDKSGIGADEKLSFESVLIMVKLFLAMAYVENGVEMDVEPVITGYGLLSQF